MHSKEILILKEKVWKRLEDGLEQVHGESEINFKRNFKKIVR